MIDIQGNMDVREDLFDRPFDPAAAVHDDLLCERDSECRVPLLQVEEDSLDLSVQLAREKPLWNVAIRTGHWRLSR